jgi:cytochrome P450
MLTRDADLAKYMLQKKHKNFEKSIIQTVHLSKYIGYGLLTATGSYWLKQRRLIQPAFHKEKINGLIEIINKSVKEQVGQIETGSFQQLYPIMNTIAFEVIAKSLFNFSADKHTLNRLQFIIGKLQQSIVTEIRQPHKKLWFKLNGSIKRSMNLVKESRAIINTIITTRKDSKENHDDLLDMLLRATYEDGTSMSSEQLIDEILILFVAGHETTANALTFTLFLLSSNKDELEKAQIESQKFSDNNITMQSFSQLSFVKQFIEESMRLYPPAWITDRVALQDEILGNYEIQKGTMIGISIYEMHRNVNYWKDPEAFIPERFSEENKKHIGHHYMPFGAGPRLCIGNNFAMFEMMLVIQNILKNYTIETNKSEVEINPLITLKPVDVELKFKLRM